MKIRTLVWSMAAGLSASMGHAAPQSGIASAGFSAALSTPTAQVLESGQLGLMLSPYLDVLGLENDGHNYVLGAGLQGNHLEIMGRLASSFESRNCFYEDCGIRDLSASVKAQLPLRLPTWMGWTPQLAVGATDLGGQTGNFRSYYGVASLSQPQWLISAGVAQKKSDQAVQARLDGVFASVIYQPLPWLQGIAEYDTESVQGGVRLISPAGALPAGIQLLGDVRTGVDGMGVDGHKLWWGIGLKMPLGGINQVNTPVPATPTLPTSPAESAAVFDARMAVEPQLTPPAALSPEQVEQDRKRLMQALTQAGFQDVAVRWSGAERQWLVQLENQVSVWNDLDAVGVALGLIQAKLSQPSPVDLTVKREGWPVLAVLASSQALHACYAQNYCKGMVWREPNRKMQGVDLKQGEQASAWRPRVELAPAVAYSVGTEFGNLDYSLGYALTVELPTNWQGGLLEGRYTHELTHSGDYAPGQQFYGGGVPNKVERVMLHQYMPLGLGTSLHAAIGKTNYDYTGGLLEGRWQSDNGAHKVDLLVGSFKRRQSGLQENRHTPMVAGYRYDLIDDDVQLRLKVGEFFDGDKGYIASTRFRFADTFIEVLYRDSKNALELERQKFAGVQISLPISPRRALATPYAVVRGAAEFNTSLLTLVGQQSNYISGIGSHGRFANAPASLDLKLYNRDRQSAAYASSHAQRLVDAYQSHLKPSLLKRLHP